MALDIRILGSGSALPTPQRAPSAHALSKGKTVYLIDCGEGTQVQLRKAKVPLESIRAIFITHLHADHVLGIFGLLASMCMTDRRTPLQIFAYKRFEEILRLNLDFFVDHHGFKIHFHPLEADEPRLIYRDRQLSVQTIPLRHRVPTVGFLFRENGFEPNIAKEYLQEFALSLREIACLKQGCDVVREDGSVIKAEAATFYRRKPVSYAYLSDTLFSERAIEFVGQVDLLYHEATYMHGLLDQAKKTGHSTTKQAAEFARRVGASKLIIGHFSSRYQELEPLLDEAREIFPNTVLARELEAHRIAWRSVR